MGNVLVIFKIYPEGPEEVEMVIEGLKTITMGDLKDVQRQPIGFGLDLIRAGFVIPDKTDGLMEKLENEIRTIKGLKEVEVEGSTLL